MHPLRQIRGLTETLGLAERAELALHFDDIQSVRCVPGNSDLVVWGRAQ